jgi:hypothetical protein
MHGRHKESARADLKVLSDTVSKGVESSTQAIVKILLKNIAKVEEDPTLLPLIRRYSFLQAGYLRGWINYYSHFYKSAMHNSLRRVDFHLRKWVRRKFKRFKQKPKGAREWLAHVIRTNPALFAHWLLLYAGQPDTGSRMSREVHVRI